MNRKERRVAAAGRGGDSGAATAVGGLLAQAVQLHQAGRPAEAEPLYRQILAIDPKHVDSLHLLGVVARQTGRHKIAVELIGQAIALNGRVPGFHNNLGNALRELGRLDDAAASYRRALTLNPGFAEAHSNLGLALTAQGRLQQAAESFRRALALKPDYAAALYNLGIVFQAEGRLAEAVEQYERALAVNPDYAEVVLADQGKLDQAVRHYERACALKPDYAEAFNNLGNALHAQGRFAEAVESYERALAARPDYAVACYNLGNALQSQGKLAEAVEAYARALALKPDYADAHNNMGSVLKDQIKLTEALAHYRQALALKPDYAEAHCNLGVVLHDLGRLAEAVASFERARALDPKAPHYAYNAELMLPKIPASVDVIREWRDHYAAGIERLTAVTGPLDDPASKLVINAFDLAYHNIDDRSLMEALRRLFRAKAPTLTSTAPHVADWRPPEGRRIRVGFLSQYLVDHTIGKLYRGLIRHLDRERFEIVLIHGSRAKRDGFSAQLDALADKILTLPGSLAAQQQAVAAETLDILFFPDIGMSGANYFLAYGRLAPVQIVSWGHPDTTGLETIDYFLSADAIEPPDADRQYTERLIRLNRLPCFYEPLPAPTTISDRTALGLPETGTLYGCPQSLFKIHPEFDGILADIAAGDPEGHIVMLEGVSAIWSGLLRERWAASHPILLSRIVFLSRQPPDRFMALMAHFDVLLDPIHFGSGNTLYEAMGYGTPIVTWPGRFMRGRIVAGAYRQMGIADAPIAERLEDYAPLALALGRDPERRRAIREASLARAGELFADMRAVREFETFLEAAVAPAGQGEKLAAGWRAGL